MRRNLRIHGPLASLNPSSAGNPRDPSAQATVGFAESELIRRPAKRDAFADICDLRPRHACLRASGEPPHNSGERRRQAPLPRTGADEERHGTQAVPGIELELDVVDAAARKLVRIDDLVVDDVANQVNRAVDPS